MTARSFAGAVSRVNASLQPAPAGDAELIERFVSDRDERAFEALVRRHGPMVLAVCRRVLRNEQDAEDAFQAAFLVLARKAGSVNPRGAVAGWLHGVAHNVARKARGRAARRAAVEAAAPPRSTELVHPEPNWDELEPVLDAELAALPEKYRAALVLCDLEGRTRAETAAALGCSEGTLSSRLTRGRRMLADRLTRRGFRCTAGALAALLAGRTAALAEPLVRATLPLASLASGAVPEVVSQLAHGVMKTMLMQKLRSAALAALVLVAGASALVALAVPTSAAPLAPVPAAPPPDEVPATLADMNARLLLSRKVLREIKCDIDQLDKIMDAVEAAEKKSQEFMNGLFGAIGPNGDPMALEKLFKDAQERADKTFRTAAGDVIKEHLSPAQRRRLAQIDLQARGHAALSTPAVVKVLKITEDQKKKLAESAEKVEAEMKEAFNPQGNGGAAIVNFDPEKVFRKAQEGANKRATDILTDEQKKAWKEMTGAPVKFELPLSGDGPFGVGFGFGGGFALPAIPVPPPPVVQPEKPN